MALGDDFKKTALTGERSRRSLESNSGAMRRAARRLRRKGYAKASEQMALDAEKTRLTEKAQRGSGFRSAEAATAERDTAIQAGKMARAMASGFRPDTAPASGELLKKRRSLYEEMKAARAAGKDVQSFRDKATALGVTSKGFDRAVGKLPGAEGGAKADTPSSTTPTPSGPTKPSGPNAPAGGSPVQGTAETGPAATSGAAPAQTSPDGPGIMDRVRDFLGKDVTNKKQGAIDAGRDDPEPAPTPEAEPDATSEITPEGLYGPTREQEGKPRQGKIDGLNAEIATRISEERAGLHERAASMAKRLQDYGYKDTKPEEFMENLRKRTYRDQTSLVLQDLRRTDPSMAKEFASAVQSQLYPRTKEEIAGARITSPISGEHDPVETLRLLRESRDNKRRKEAEEERKRLAARKSLRQQYAPTL